MEILKVGIIGADSYHCVALVEQYLKMEHVQVTFVDTTIRGHLDMSLERQERFLNMLRGKVVLEEIDLQNHMTVDLYIVLNTDSSTHLSTIMALSKYQVPIFVDKPIFTDLSSFNQVTGTVMSSSGLRFVDMVRDITCANHIDIEAPLFYVDGVDGYFWYGIHMVEILESLTNASMSIDSIEVEEDGEVIKGHSGEHTFRLHGKYSDVNFKISTGNETRELLSYDHLYYSLAKSILDVDTWPSLSRTKRVIETVIEINHKKSKL